MKTCFVCLRKSAWDFCCLVHFKFEQCLSFCFFSLFDPRMQLALRWRLNCSSCWCGWGERSYPVERHGHGRRKGGQGGLGALLDFENFNKKGCFLSFEREKPNFTTFGPRCKNFENIPWCPPPGKNLSDAHGHGDSPSRPFHWEVDTVQFSFLPLIAPDMEEAWPVRPLALSGIWSGWHWSAVSPTQHGSSFKSRCSHYSPVSVSATLPCVLLTTHQQSREFCMED